MKKIELRSPLYQLTPRVQLRGPKLIAIKTKAKPQVMVAYHEVSK